jgi:hypothetical protein
MHSQHETFSAEWYLNPLLRSLSVILSFEYVQF